MPNIITTSYFVNDLDVPNSKPVAGGANNISHLKECITTIERSLLLNSLGLTIYNELQAVLPIVDTTEDKWKWLVNGKEYDGKVWDGLANPKSLIAYAAYCAFLDQNSHFWTTTGTVRTDTENSENITPAFKIATNWQVFLRKYQDGCHKHPITEYGIGWVYRDYFGNHDNIMVSLYQYLRDNKDLYGWGESNFMMYEQKNSFGL